jgi:hypothetical protein
VKQRRTSLDVDGEKESSLLDFNDVEKRFASDEIIESLSSHRAKQRLVSE